MQKKDEHKLLELISEHCFLPSDTIKEVYIGIVKAAATSLRRERRFLLPDLLELLLVPYKSKLMSNRHAGGLTKIPETKRVKVKIDYKLKRFLKE